MKAPTGDWLTFISVARITRLRRRRGNRLDQHFADWDITDRVSGATASIDDYLLKGVHLAFAYRF